MGRIERFGVPWDTTLTRRVLVDEDAPVREDYLFKQLLFPAKEALDGERLDTLTSQEAANFKTFYGWISKQTRLRPNNQLLKGTLVVDKQPFHVYLADKFEYNTRQKQIVIASEDKTRVFVFGDNVHEYRGMGSFYERVGVYDQQEALAVMQQFSKSPKRK